MTLRTLVAIVALLCFVTPSRAQSIRLEFENGLVTLTAQNAPLRAILAEWAQLGSSTVVNGDQVVGPPGHAGARQRAGTAGARCTSSRGQWLHARPETRRCDWTVEFRSDRDPPDEHGAATAPTRTDVSDAATVSRTARGRQPGRGRRGQRTIERRGTGSGSRAHRSAAARRPWRGPAIGDASSGGRRANARQPVWRAVRHDQPPGRHNASAPADVAERQACPEP